MDYSQYIMVEEDLHLQKVRHFSLPEILECGQAFRWQPVSHNRYRGIAHGRVLELTHREDTLIFHSTPPEEFEALWKEYFDFTRDYGEVKELLSQNPTLNKAIAHAPGIRVLRQDPWETLCTFIFSQTNNIKRITGLVENFSKAFGEPIIGPDGSSAYSFPTVQRIARLTVEDLAPVRAGFRAKYIIDAAQKVQEGTVSLSAPYTLPYAEGREHLMQIYGVGPKVADCVLLFAYGQLESFPLDVWMLRVVDTFYPKGFPKKYSHWAGLAQQYLFHYARSNPQLVTPVDKKETP